MECQAVVVALRPWSFTASLTPVLLGSAVAYKLTDTLDIAVLICVSVIAIAVHSAGNLVNTYYDYIRGVDDAKADDRTLVEGKLSVNDVATLGALAYGIGCAALLLLCNISGAKVEHLALIYFCGLSGSFLYTGGLGLKYIALGDIVIFLTFGPLTVLFAFLAQTGSFSGAVVWYAMPLALNIECVLHANNCRDRESDSKAGIVTLAILIGRSWSYFLFCILLFGPFVAFGYVTVHFTPFFIFPTVTIFLAFPIERSFRAGKLDNLPRRIAKLNLIMGSAFIIAIVLASRENLPMLTS